MGYKDRENRGNSVEYQHSTRALGSQIPKKIPECPAMKSMRWPQ
jgi:hypothetical protein